MFQVPPIMENIYFKCVFIKKHKILQSSFHIKSKNIILYEMKCLGIRKVRLVRM